jgi:hypothetical protein
MLLDDQWLLVLLLTCSRSAEALQSFKLHVSTLELPLVVLLQQQGPDPLPSLADSA